MRALRALAFAAGLSFTGTAAVVSTPAAAETKVAVVDLQRAINEVNAGAQAKARIEGAIGQKRASIEAMQADLQQRVETYQKQQMVLSDQARAIKEQELNQAQMTFQQSYVQAQEEMQALEMQLMDELIGKLRPVCEKIAKEKGYTLVLESNTGVVWAEPSTDITNEVIKRFNAGG
jgi:outer membrane protein